MAKQDIDFILIDESVVQDGFRVLMSGYQPGLFESNPIMLINHQRAFSNALLGGALSDDAVLPIGLWYDIRIDNARLLAKPEFDDDDDMAVKVQNKVIKKYMRAVSVALIPLEVSDDPTLKLSGQVGPTVTKWEIAECSVTDIPNCRNALAIRNKIGKTIALSGDNAQAVEYLQSLLNTQNNIPMDKKLLAGKLGLTETASDADLLAKLSAVVTDAAQVTTLKTENQQLLSAKTDAETKLKALEDAQQAAQVTDLVDGAVTAMKLTAKDKDHYIKLAKADFPTTKLLIDGMQPYTSIRESLDSKDEAAKAELQELIKLSGRELYLKGKFGRLKQLSAPHYKAKYKEYFKTEAKEA